MTLDTHLHIDMFKSTFMASSLVHHSDASNQPDDHSEPWTSKSSLSPPSVFPASLLGLSALLSGAPPPQAQASAGYASQAKSVTFEDGKAPGDGEPDPSRRRTTWPLQETPSQSAAGDQGPRRQSVDGSGSAGRPPTKSSKDILGQTEYNKALVSLGYMISARFRQNRQMQLEGMKALSQLILKPKERWQKILSMGACEAIPAGTRRFPADASMARDGCLAVANLAMAGFGREWPPEDHEVHLKLLKGGACEAALEAMRAFPENAAVQQAACSSAAALGRHGEARQQLVEAGACEAVLKAMQAFPDELPVQIAACNALGSVAWGQEGHPAEQQL